MWRGLIRKGDGEYKDKIIRYTKQKCAQRKVKGKALPTELSSSDLSCPDYNGEFKTKIVLTGHRRTYKQYSTSNA